jgi:hypothetical protein
VTSSIRRWFTGVGASMVLWPAIAEAQVMTRSSDGLRNNQSFARSQVSAAQKKDGLANGALIGAAVGAGAALSILAIAGSGEGYVLPSAKVGAPLLLSGVGALVGALVDRAHESSRLPYVLPGPTSRLVVSPLVGKDRQGVLVYVHF